MAETCIVCLGDLRSSVLEDPPPEGSAARSTSGDTVTAGKDDVAKNITSAGADAKRYPPPEPVLRETNDPFFRLHWR